jgi:hypothetical protein
VATADLWTDFFDPSTYYSGPPLTDALVAAAERLLGYTLPASYVRLLRVKNGGCPKRQCHPAAGARRSDSHVRVVSLFGIGGQWGIDAAEFGSRSLIEQGGFPELGVLIGWTPTAGDDAIMLDYGPCGPHGEPRVSLADAESGGGVLLAPSFEAFVVGLVDCRPYEEARARAREERRRRPHPGWESPGRITHRGR